MKKEEFATRVLDLWMTTRIPMTLTALQYHSGAPRAKVSKWLDALLAEGALELDSDDHGELIYCVPGARRPSTGAANFAELEKLALLGAEVDADSARRRAAIAAAQAAAEEQRARAALKTQQALVAKEQHKSKTLDKLRGQLSTKNALAMAHSARTELDRPRPAGEKSLIASGALSFFLGPLGWLYAGAWREAIPASVLYLLLIALIPTFFLVPLLPVVMGVSGVGGVVYAWSHNKKGQRTPILGPGDDVE